MSGETPSDPPQAPVEGWYVDTDKPEQLRFWDGAKWTGATQPNKNFKKPAELTPAKKGGVPTWVWVVSGIVLLPIVIAALGGGEDPGKADDTTTTVEARATLEGQIVQGMETAGAEQVEVECRRGKTFCGAEGFVELLGAFDKTRLAESISGAMRPMFADDRVIQGLVTLNGATVSAGGKEGEGALLTVTCDSFTVDSEINFDAITLEGYRDVCEMEQHVNGIFD